MSDEIDQAPTVDTPPVDTPDTPAEVNWQKRYEDLQPEYTRTSQALRRFETDPNAVVEFLQQHHPDLLAEEDEQDDQDLGGDDDTPQFLTRAEWEQHQAQQAAEKATQQFETDLTKFVGDERELSAHGRNSIVYQVAQGNIKTPEQLEQAVNDWFSYEDQLRTPTEPEQEAKRRKPPHVVPGGAPNTGAKPFHEMTSAEREAYMVERATALGSQT